jgi:hypothetical protein
MATRDELLGALTARYGQSSRADKGRIVTEFVAVTGYHRKHARGFFAAGQGRSIEASARAPALRRRCPRGADRAVGGVGPDLRQAVEAAHPDAGRRDGAPWASGPGSRGAGAARGDQRRDDRPDPRAGAQAGGRSGRRRTGASSAIRRAVPIRTYADWNDPPPGFFEADLVSHSGPLTSGSFAQTLVLTDISSGWTECAPLLFREQQLLTRGADRAARA